MLFSSYVSLALAAGVQSFLVPGDVDALSKEVDNNSPAPLSRKQQFPLTLDCSSCPFALNSQRNDDHEWTNDVQSDLHMTFDASEESLRLNGVPFYPIQGVVPPQLHVSQTRKDGEDPTFQEFPGDLRLSYSLEYGEKKADDGSSLVEVTMTIMALDGQMVKIDNVEVKAIKTADGQLILHSVNPVHPDPNSIDAKCGNVLCRVFAKIISGVKKAKAAAKTTCYNVKCLCVKCYKSLTGAVKHIHKKPAAGLPLPPPEDETVKLPSHHRFRPAMFGGAHPHHHHAHHRKGFFHRMGHVMWSTLKIAFMPILIGIAFGVAASAIGMLVGQLIVALWTRFRKTTQVVYIPIETDEKSGLPAYEDVPSQEVSAEKEGEDIA